MALTFSHCATLVYVPYACPATVPVPMCLFLSSISPTSPKRHASEPALDTAAVGGVSPSKVPSSLGHQHAIPTQWFNRGAQTNRVQRQGQPTLTTTTATWKLEPTWNTAAAKVPAFLASLKRHDYLYNRTKGALSLYTRGYTIDNKNRKVVLGWRHIEHLQAEPTKRYTFEEPSPLATYAPTDAPTELASKIRLGAHPIYATSDDDDAKKAEPRRRTTMQRL